MPQLSHADVDQTRAESEKSPCKWSQRSSGSSDFSRSVFDDFAFVLLAFVIDRTFVRMLGHSDVIFCDSRFFVVGILCSTAVPDQLHLDGLPSRLFLFADDVLEDMVHGFQRAARCFRHKIESPNQRQEAKDGEEGVSPEPGVEDKRRRYLKHTLSLAISEAAPWTGLELLGWTIPGQ